MTQPVTMELQDYIDELTRPHQHREHYTRDLGATKYQLDHVTAVPSLLDQLQYASPSGNGEERGGGGYESRPAASVESISMLADIDIEAARWVKTFGEDDPATTAACVRLLGALAVREPACRNRHRECEDGCTKQHRGCCPRHDIERAVRHWWAQARVITGWDSPAWRPDNTCPMCDARGSLRIKLVDQIGFCTECKDTWDHTTISHLADHIRSESAGIRSVPAKVYCWCQWPRPDVDAWPSLCPDCRSPWCHRAGWVKALEGPASTPEHSFSVDVDGRMGA